MMPKVDGLEVCRRLKADKSLPFTPIILVTARSETKDVVAGLGIAQGYATLGRIGFEGRFDYAAIGTVVNLAARLCSEAVDNQILIDRKVQVAVEDHAMTSPVGQLTLKGLNRQVATFNVMSVDQ